MSEETVVEAAPVESTSESTEASTEHWSSSVDWQGGDDFTVPEKISEFKTPAELAKAYENARMKINSKGILVPGEKATDDEKAAFQSQLREQLGIAVPESPDKYGWKAPEDLSDYFEDVGEQLKAYHEAGMDDKTVGLVLDNQANAIKTMMNAMSESQVEIAKQSEEALKEKWGSDYDKRIASVNKLKERYPDAVEQLVSGGMANSQPILEMMDEVSRSIREDKPAGSSDSPSGDFDSQLKAIKESEAYTSRRHPEHKQAINKVLELQRMKLQK